MDGDTMVFMAISLAVFCVLVAAQSLVLMRIGNRLLRLGDALNESLKSKTMRSGQSGRTRAVEEGTGGSNTIDRRQPVG